MKKYILTLAFLGGAAVASAASGTDTVALPEMKVVDSWKQVTQYALPEYPVELRRSGETGRVSLDIIVNRDGHVTAIHVLASDNDALEDAARDAVRRWRFIPDQKSVMRDVRHARVTFNFELEEKA